MSDGDRGARLAFGDLAGLLAGIILAITVVGVVAYSGGRQSALPPDGSSYPNQRQPTTAIERPVQGASDAQAQEAEPGEYQAPCRDGEYNNKSDLCAQWYAARAARDAADWAYWAVFWGVISLGLSSLGLIALLVTIRQGRDANKIARDIGQAQVRAYLTIEKVECRTAQDGLSFKATVRNSGNSPALAAQIFIKVIHGDGSKTILDPFEEHTVPAQGLTEFAECFWLFDLAIQLPTILILVDVGYADVFGQIERISERFATLTEALSGTYQQMTPGKHIASYIRASDGVGPSPVEDDSTDDDKHPHADG